MVENIEARGCSLLGINECPSTEAQEQRMLRVLSVLKDSLISIESITLDKVYNERLNLNNEKTRIEKIEMFDEWEEFNMLQGHYCLTLGTRG